VTIAVRSHGRALRWGAVVGRLGRRGTTIAALTVLVAAGAALAAAHFRAGAVYTSKSCENPGVQGTTCVYRFQASKNGGSLKFVGTTVITTWGCNGGGGEALLGGKHDGADPLPVLKVRPKGALYGSAGTGQDEVSVTGHLAGSGNSAVVTFHLTKQGCHTVPVTLTAH
jgi:hypothetical protein